MKPQTALIAVVLALVIAFSLSACTDPTQKALNRAREETNAAYRAANEAQRGYDELLRDYALYKQTQEMLGQSKAP